MYIDISDKERICLQADNATHADKADTADKLSYKRLINGVEFDGSSDIYFYGTCSTAKGTAAKTVTLQSGSSFVLKTGVTIAVKFTNANTIANPTLNVNNTGAKPIYRYGTTAASTSDTTTGWRAGSVLLLTYDGTGWIRHFWENTNTVPAGYCTTAADTAAKTASCTDYALKTNSYLHLIIKTANTSQTALTLNVNSKGAKPIYINGAASSTSNYTLPAGSYIAFYDGTNYYIRTDGKLPGSIESATTASNLNNYSVGSSQRPVYFNGGVPTQTTYRMAGTNAAATTAMAISSDLPTGIWYVNGTNTGDHKVSDFNQQDGVVIANQYSDKWITEIYQDYRTGQLAVRGKNNGTWQVWRKVLDDTNYTSYTVKKDGTGASGTWGISITGNAATASKLSAQRTITLTGDVTGSGSSDGSTGWSITATVKDDSHNHVISNVDGLQDALNGKISSGASSLEMNSGGSLAKYGGFIDFHYHDADGKPTDTSGAVVEKTPDYTSRIIEDAPGVIKVNGVAFQGGNITGTLKGTADKANNLGNYSVGGSTQPVYFNGGVPTVVSAVGTAYGGTGNTSYTANRVVYASAADKLASSNLSMSGYEASMTASSTSGVKYQATNSNGSISLFTSTNRGMYDETNKKWIININTAGDHTYVVNWKSKGSADTPVYFNANGEPTTASKYAGGTQVTLNGTSKSASTASFYAPTDAGTAGYILKSNGSGKAPTWDTIGNLMNSTFVNVTGDTMTGNLVVTNTANSISLNTGGTITQQVTAEGGWARGTSWNHKNGDTVTALGCTGMFGSGATVTHFYIGNAYNDTWMTVTPGGHVTATKFIGDLQGAASRLSTSAGSASQPVYFSGGVPTAITAVGAAYGGTGKTSLVDSANALINALSTGDAVPGDNDYFVSQYANGGTTTTTYHRRPVSKLYDYIKGKAEGTWAISISGNAATATHATTSGTAGSTNITLNGSAQSTANASFYAPTASGTAGQVLISSGDKKAPAWTGILNVTSSKSTTTTNRTAQGTISAVSIYGTAYGNDATYLEAEKQLSYGDPGPQIIFNTSKTGSQAAALIFTDHDTIATGCSLSLVSNQSNVSFIAPTIRALTKFVGELDGNAKTATNANYATSAGTAGSANSATTATTATTATRISLNGIADGTTYGTYGGIIQDSSTGPEAGSWHNSIKILHNNNNKGWYTQLAQNFTGTEGLWHRSYRNGVQGSWHRVLDSNCYTDYTVKKDGTGASGTWGISITGNANYATSAGTAGSATKDSAGNTISTYYAPKNHASTTTTYGVGDKDNYGHVILYPAASCSTYTSDAGGAVTPAAAKKAVTLFTNDYAPTKTGGGASGTWGISISGNAASASTAGTAGKLLDTVSVGGSTTPVYFSKGSPVACGVYSKGTKAFGTVATVGTDGVQEIGRYIDFHYTNDSANDYDVRIDSAGTNKNTLYLPGVTGQVVVHTNDTAIGGSDTPVYIAATGAATAASKYAGGTQVKLNNVSKSASTAEFYAPTEAGTAGQVLKSAGSGKAPVWASVSDLLDGRFVNASGDTMTGNLNFTGEKSIIGKIERKAAGTGGWAYAPVRVIGNDDAVFANIGVFGGADALTYMYIGAGDWDSDVNVRISPTGAVTAKSFVGPLTGNASSATTATKDSSGAVIKDTYVKKAGDTMSGALNTSYQSSTWINSANGKSAINLTGTGYTGWISGNSKDGKLVISSYPNSTNLLYFGYMSKTRIEAGTNSFEQSMTWDGSTNTLTATTFKGALDGNAKTATTATKMADSRTITLTGDVTGSASSDWTTGWSITATVADDSHNHIIANVDGLQTALNGKMTGSPTSIELNTTGGLKSYGGFIDFHFHDASGNPGNPTSDGKTPDYTSRIIENAVGQININGVSFKDGNVTGTFKGTADKATALTTSAGSSSRPVYFSGGVPTAITAVGAAYGGTGKTSLVDSANALLNALSTGSSTPVDNDYFISQYVNGGTTTTTYHRRPVSKLYDYIKGKAEGTWAISISGNAATASYATSAGSAGTAGSATKATQDGDGNVITSTYAKLQSPNNMIHAGNEVTWVPSGYKDHLWLNYQTCGGKNGNITHYNFGNGKGGTAGVTLVADAFSGKAATAGNADYATTAGTAGSAGSANRLSILRSIGSGTTNHGDALKAEFNSNKGTIPRNELITYYSSTSGNGSQYMGYFLNGYNDNPYGGFYVAHYNNPYYVGIQNGTYSTQAILTNTNYSSYALPLSGGTVTGTLVLSKTTDAAADANNGPALIIGGTQTTTHIEIDCNEVIAKSDGTTETDLYLGTNSAKVHIGQSNIGGSTGPIYLKAGVPTACSGRTVPGIKSASAVGTLGWGTNNTYVADISLLAYWNGAYKDTASNLAYCDRGRFGTIVTRDSTDYLRYYDANTEMTTTETVGASTYLHTVSTTGGNITTTTKPTGMDNAWGVLHMHLHSGNYAMQLGFGGTTGNLYMRNAYNSATFGAWRTILDTGNYTGTLDGRYLKLSGGTMSGSINMNNNTITNINDLTFADPGPNEGIAWTGGNGWKIYESPNDLTTNSSGNLQFVCGSARILTAKTSGGIEVYTGSSQSGVQLGGTYITAIGSSTIFQNNGEIRFGGGDWDWNNWAGLKYVHSSKTVYLGIADGTQFGANAAQSGGTLALPAIRYLSINGKTAIDANDSWLRINEGKAFSSGIYMGTNIVRTDGQFQVGSSGANFYANSSGNGYFSNTLGIAGSNTSYKLYVKGTSRFDGTVFGYNYTNNNNAAAFIWDKPSSHYTGVGACGTNNMIHFGPCNADGTWVSSYDQIWRFQGSLSIGTQIYNTAYRGGMWCKGRDNALVRTVHSASSSSFAPVVSAKTQLGSWDLGPCHPDEHFYIGYCPDTSYNGGTNSGTVHAVRITKEGQLYGAVWNDYAEYRSCITTFEAGQVVCENGDDTLSLATERLQPGACIVSDTFGFAIGETDIADCPIAVAGRVLAYPYEPRESYKAGDPVCAGPGGTVSKMTREEVREYPDRMIGTVSAIPKYETWGQDNIPVNGRIWIKVV